MMATVKIPPIKGILDLGLLGIWGTGARLDKMSNQDRFKDGIAYIQYETFKVFLSGDILMER
jgi:hypothetical protein